MLVVKHQLFKYLIVNYLSNMFEINIPDVHFAVRLLQIPDSKRRVLHIDSRPRQLGQDYVSRTSEDEILVRLQNDESVEDYVDGRM